MAHPKNDEEHEEMLLATIRDGTYVQATPGLTLDERGTKRLKTNLVSNSKLLSSTEWARDPELNNGRGYYFGEYIVGDYPYMVYLSSKKFPHIEAIFKKTRTNKVLVCCSDLNT